MSSYVIPKEHYVKAAGIVAGIASGRSSERFWLYDYEFRRNMTPEDYYTRFVECFEMNALSVQEQYHDDEAEIDLKDYRKTFLHYLSASKTLEWSNPAKYREVVRSLCDFFNSSVYQVENFAYMFRIRSFFDRIIVQLMEPLIGCDPTYLEDLSI